MEEVGLSGEQVIIVNLLTEVDGQEQLTVVEGMEVVAYFMLRINDYTLLKQRWTTICFFLTSANKGDLTSDQLSSDAVETTAAEAVLTDCKESIPGQQHQVTCIALIMVNSWVG